MPAGAAAATSHVQKRPAKTVSVPGRAGVAPLSCTGHTLRTAHNGAVHLSFWSTKNGSHTCIGTIKVKGAGPPASGWVSRAGTEYCFHQGEPNVSDVYSFGCHESFKRPLSVVGGGLGIFATHYIS